MTSTSPPSPRSTLLFGSRGESVYAFSADAAVFRRLRRSRRRYCNSSAFSRSTTACLSGSPRRPNRCSTLSIPTSPMASRISRLSASSSTGAGTQRSTVSESPSPTTRSSRSNSENTALSVRTSSNTLTMLTVTGMEDLVHEIATCGPNFKQATSSLWPFKLSNPNGGWRPRKFIGYVEGGDAGNREKHMSKLIHQMV